MSSPLGATETEKRPAANENAHQPGSLLARYHVVRQMTEQLARPLSPEDCQIQSMPDASPVKWHLAHTTWFFETFVLAAHAGDFKTHHPSFVYLFNSYYNAVGDRLPRARRGLITRPTLTEVYAYRAATDRAMEAYLESAGEALSATVAAVIELGLNHEQQHQELILTDIKHALAQNPLRPAYRDDLDSPLDGATAPMGWSFDPGGIKWIGHESRGFAFDNEGPRHRVFCEPFQIGARLVTGGEFQSFIDDRGYDRPELWLADGWSAAMAHGWRAPLYWEKIEGAWWSQTLGGFRRVPEAEPVCHVSYYEADAFARWAGTRLPTEWEWESVARDRQPDGNFLESGHFHPQAAPAGAELAQCFGDVWEWTGSPYMPYPGSRPAAGALGENSSS
jgi:ergothioneine biosynthesis protein EgtB